MKCSDDVDDLECNNDDDDDDDDINQQISVSASTVTGLKVFFTKPFNLFLFLILMFVSSVIAKGKISCQLPSGFKGFKYLNTFF